ncbi:MAG TPA: hypothetical protein VGQ53_23110 [Chitinophagaceae bacterium]|jgi:hypothetical protein|nr:hypothetical protein [Chitinophagaceae bacterium]
MEEIGQSTDKINQYRQPMVTAAGIFLGFMLNFTAVWIKDAFSKYMFRDMVVAISTVVCLFSLLLVLFRMLRMRYPVEPEKFYRRTLFFFLIGITVPFLAFLIVIIEKLLTNI